MCGGSGSKFRGGQEGNLGGQTVKPKTHPAIKPGKKPNTASRARGHSSFRKK